MRRAYLIALPPGAGKTRTVLQHLRSRVKGNLVTLCENLLVLGPNKRVEHVWLRELALLASSRNSHDHRMIRESSPMLLRRRLARKNLHLRFLSFRDLETKTKLRASAMIVLDEWHRYSGTKSNLLAQAKVGPLGNHTYFVSATPLNPVMEEERDILVENPRDDVDSIKECREHALKLIAELTSIPYSDQILSQPFANSIKMMGIRWIDRRTGWRIPVIKRSPTGAKWSDKELEYLSHARTYGEKPGWKSQEAAWAIGLVRTKFDKTSKKFLLNSSSLGSKKMVFGHSYVQPHIPNQSKCASAAKWLLNEHPRVPRLISLLQQCGVISSVNGLDKYELTKRKVLIFCVHQGIARGLQLALKAVIPSPNNEIACAVHEFTDEHQNDFMVRGRGPYILIATDKLSESIDLHGACRVLVHYELPWSPLRLLQRVGRLTRMHADKSFRETEVHHIVIPGSVEEERINRLVRRTSLLHEEGAWPEELYNGRRKDWMRIGRALIGSGSSMHLAELVNHLRPVEYI